MPPSKKKDVKPTQKIPNIEHLPLEKPLSRAIQKINEQIFLFIIALAIIIAVIFLLASNDRFQQLGFIVGALIFLGISALITFTIYDKRVRRMRSENKNQASTEQGNNRDREVPINPQPQSVNQPDQEEISLVSANTPSLSSTQKFTLIEAFLACPSMNQRQRRDTVIRNLPSQIQNSIVRRDDNRSDVDEIVNACLNHVHGLAQLLEIVRQFDKGTIAFEKLERLLDGT